jgi:hypothetical protein
VRRSFHSALSLVLEDALLILLFSPTVDNGFSFDIWRSPQAHHLCEFRCTGLMTRLESKSLAADPCTCRIKAKPGEDGEFIVVESMRRHTCGVVSAREKAKRSKIDMEKRIASLEKKREREEAVEAEEDADKVVERGRSSGQKKVEQQPTNDDDTELSSLSDSDDDKKKPTSKEVGFSSTSRRRSSSRQPVKAYSSALPSATTSLVSKRSRLLRWEEGLEEKGA